MNDSYVSFLAPILPLLIPRLGLSLAMAGLLVSTLSTSTSLAQPLFGHLIDRVHLDFFLVASPAVTGLALSCIGLAPSYGVLVVCLVVGGLSTAVFHPQAMSLIPAVGGERKGMSMSIFNAGGTLGYSLGPVFVLWVVETAGFQGTWRAAVPGVTLSVLLYFVIRLRNPGGAAEILSNGGSPKPANRPKPDGIGASFGAGSVLLRLWLILALRATVYSSFTNFLPVLLENRGWESMKTGWLLFVWSGSGALGALAAGYISDRMNRRTVIMSALVMTIPAMWYVLRVGDTALFVLAFFAGALLNSIVPVGVVLGQEVLPGRPGTAAGIMVGGTFGVGGLMVSVVGWFADHVGLQVALTSILSLLVVAATLSVTLPEKPEGAPVEEAPSLAIR